MAISTKPPSGFRDFRPTEVRLRNHVFGVIEEVYRSYGFEQLDTPALERLDTLLGKYGAEGDQLLFKVLKRGDKLTRALGAGEVKDVDLADMGLRYDLTVPLARVYAQYRNEFPRIFKRFQIAPVWRADRPQRGRFREFYQCDVDVVGSKSMTVEVEVMSALCDILNRLEFGSFRIHVNHRVVLFASIRAAGVPDALSLAAIGAIDKLDKIGTEGVAAELAAAGVSPAAVEQLTTSFEAFGEADNAGVLTQLGTLLAGDEDGLRGLGDLREILRLAEPTTCAEHLVLDPSLARGLSYYTGPIFEIRSDDFNGSLGGGGRYDELIGMFMKENVPACGFSLGVERILVLMEERGLSIDAAAAADVLVTLFDPSTTVFALKLARDLRASGLRVDVYTDEDKLGKQFKYADQRGIPFVAVLGPSEVAEGVVAVKDMRSGEQVKVPLDAAPRHFAES